MSRNPSTMAGTRRHQNMAEDDVNFVEPCNMPNTMNIEDVKLATETYDFMQTIITLCRNGLWFEICKSDDPVMREFHKVRKELSLTTVTDDSTLQRGMWSIQSP